MEYLQIVLNGYIDQNSRLYLVEYFIREAKKAKIKDFNYDEFFNGCLGIVEAMEQQLKERLNKTKSGLDYAIISARNRTLKSDTFDSSKDYSTQCNEAVIRFKDQISELNLDNYILNLGHFTNGYATGNLPYHEIQIIKDAILKAKLKTSIDDNAGNTKKTIFAGFQSSLTDQQIDNLYTQMQGNYINSTPIHFKAIFCGETLPPKFIAIQRLKIFTTVLCAYFVSKLFQKENPGDYWSIAENCFEAKSLRQSLNNAYQFNPNQKPRGYKKIDTILKNIYIPLQ